MAQYRTMPCQVEAIQWTGNTILLQAETTTS